MPGELETEITLIQPAEAEPDDRQMELIAEYECFGEAEPVAECFTYGLVEDQQEGRMFDRVESGSAVLSKKWTDIDEPYVTVAVIVKKAKSKRVLGKPVRILKAFENRSGSKIISHQQYTQ